MALSLIPGAAIPVGLASLSAQTVKTIAGEKNYNDARGAITWSYGAFVGFTPVDPLFMPVQLGLFITFTLILIFVFKVGVGWSLLGAYFAQGIVVMCAAQWILDKFLKWGIGV